MIFDDMDEKLLDFLETLTWPTVNNRVLSYPADHKMLINNFRKLLQQNVYYNADKIKEWLRFHQRENLLQDNVIDNIGRLADYTKIDFYEINEFRG